MATDVLVVDNGCGHLTWTPRAQVQNFLQEMNAEELAREGITLEEAIQAGLDLRRAVCHELSIGILMATSLCAVIKKSDEHELEMILARRNTLIDEFTAKMLALYKQISPSIQPLTHSRSRCRFRAPRN